MRIAQAIALFEQRVADAGADLPIAAERVNFAIRNAVAQMAVYVLQILRLGDFRRGVELAFSFARPSGEAPGLNFCIALGVKNKIIGNQ